MFRLTPDPLFRVFGAVLSIIVCLVILPPPALRAQPVSIDPLNLDRFDAADFSRAAEAARQSRSEAEFDALFSAERQIVVAAWEATVDAQIDAQVAAVGHNDHFHTVEEYRQYVRESLELQKTAGRAEWENAADEEIERERFAFLTALSSKHSGEAIEEGADQVEAGQAAVNRQDGSARDDVNRARQEYEARYQTGVDQTLKEFSDAISKVNTDSEAFRAGQEQAAQEFASALADIDSYEATVRSAIDAAVSGLDNQLRTSGVFQLETCDLENVCTTDPDTLNAAGQALAGLLGELRDGLTANAPISVLAGRLQEYLAEREARAIENRDHWQALIYENRNLANEGQQPGHGLNFSLYEGAITGSLIEYLRGNQAALINARSSGHRRAQDFTSVDLRGISPIYQPYPLTGAVDRNRQWWLQDGAGEGALTYDAEGCGGFGGIACIMNFFAPNGHPEFSIELRGTYRLYDPNAENNRDVWAGYSDDLSVANQAWLETLLPAIDAWEQQAAEFRARYTAWQADSAAALDESVRARDAQIQSLTALRNQTLARLESERRDGLADFRELELKINQQETRDRIAAEADRLAQSGTLIQGGATAAELIAATAINNLPSAVPASPVGSLPDFSGAVQVESAIRQTLAASLNVAVAENLSDEARTLQDRASQRLLKFTRASNDLSVSDEEVYAALVAMMDSYTFDVDPADVDLDWSELDVRTQAEFDDLRTSVRQSILDRKTRQQFKSTEILSNGSIRVTRDLSKGRTYLRAGGDAQNADDYIEELAEHSFVIDGTGAVRLSQTASLFDAAFDANQALGEFDQSKDAYEQSVDSVFATAAEKIEAQNNLVEQMHARAEKHTQGQVSAAKQAASLAQALITGGTIQSWVEGQMRSQMAAEIEARTGLPAGFMSGLLGGMKPHEAAYSFFEGQMFSQLEKDLGLAPGLLAMFVGEQKKKNAAKKSPTSKLAGNLAGMGTFMATVGGAMVGMLSGGPLAAISGAAAGYAASKVVEPAVADFYERNPMAMDVAAFTTTAVTSNPGVWYSYQAAKGYHNGGALGAVTAVADTALIGLSYMTPFEASVSYTHDAGFGASAGVGLRGVASAGISFSDLAGAGAYASLGNAVGPSVSLNSSQYGGSTVAGKFGVGLGKNNSAGLVGLGLSYNTNTGGGASLGYTRSLRDVPKDGGVGASGNFGLSWNETNGIGVNTGFSLSDNPASESETENPEILERISPFTGTGLALNYTERAGLSMSASLGEGSVGSYNFAQGEFNYNESFMHDSARSFLAAERQRQQAQELNNAFRVEVAAHRDKMTPEEYERWNSGAMTIEEMADVIKRVEANGDDLVLANTDESSFGESVFDDLYSKAYMLGETIIGRNVNQYGFIDDRGEFHVRTCFVAGTLVHTDRGLVAIESIRVGDRVRSWNEDTRVESYNMVTELIRHDVQMTYDVEFSGGQTLGATWNHPFRIDDRWVETKDLKAGDQGFLVGGERIGVAAIRERREATTVFNIEVENDHTYFVGEIGVLVHNYDGHENESAYLNLMNVDTVPILATEGLDGVIHKEGERLFPRLIRPLKTPPEAGEANRYTVEGLDLEEVEQTLIDQIQERFGSDADLSKGAHVVTLRNPDSVNDIQRGRVAYDDINVTMVDGKIKTVTLASGSPGVPGKTQTNDGHHKNLFVPVATNNSRAGGLLRLPGDGVPDTRFVPGKGYVGAAGVAVGHHIHEGDARAFVGNWSHGCTVNNLGKVIAVSDSSVLGFNNRKIERIDFRPAYASRAQANNADYFNRPGRMGAQSYFMNSFVGQKTVSQTMVTVPPRSSNPLRGKYASRPLRDLYSELYGKLR